MSDLITESECLIPKPSASTAGTNCSWRWRSSRAGLISQIEQISACGDKVMVVIRTPGVDRVRARQAEDRNFLVLTLAQERIIRMRACRDRDEARAFAGTT
jgi:hypothetical protein